MPKLILDSGSLDTQERKVNLNYLCMITCQGLNKAVALQLPEEFNFSIGTQYAQPWAQGFAKSEFMKNLALAGSVTGFGIPVSQSSTLQVWQGTSEVSFSLTFELVATTDAYKEVIDPIKQLLFLTLPGTKGKDGSGILVPPGPSLNFKDFAEWVKLKATFENEISLQIGNFIRFDSVVIESVNHVFDSHFDVNGNPLSGRVDVSFKTFVVPVRDDIDKMFFSSPPAERGQYSKTGGV